MGRAGDVVVVGGGVMGAAIALALAERGAGRIWLLEKSHPAAGSSGKSGAILRQHYSHPETVRMAREGLHAYRDFAARTGRDIGFTRHGMVFLVDPRDADALRANVAMQRAEGVPTEVVDEDELAHREPRGFYPEGALAAWEDDAGSVDPRRAVEAMVAEAESRGVILVQGETVSGLRRRDDTVTGVETSHGGLDAAHVVLATGPWSAARFTEWGLPLPLRVVRPQQAFLEPPAGFGDPIPIFADLTLGTYWKPEGARHTRVGWVYTSDDASVDDPDHYDEGVDGVFVAEARRRVGERLPGYRRATAWGGCAALYTMTPDDHAVVGPPPGLGGVTVATGFSGHGFKLAPAVGRGVAEWIVDGQPRAFPAAFFAADRFGSEREITPRYRFGLLG